MVLKGFLTVSTVVVVLKELIFNQFLLLKDAVVLKELDF